MKEKSIKTEKKLEEALRPINPLNSTKGLHEYNQSEKRVWNNVSQFIEDFDSINKLRLPKSSFLLPKITLTYTKYLALSLVTVLLVSGLSLTYFNNKSLKTSDIIRLDGSTSQLKTDQTASRAKIVSAEQLTPLFAAQNEKLYGVSNLSQSLSQEQIEKLTQQKDKSKVLYIKQTTNLYTDENGKNLPNGGHTETQETWSSGLFYKQIHTWNGKINSIVVETPDYEFKYDLNIDTNHGEAKLIRYKDSKNVEALMWAKMDFYVLKHVVEANTLVQQKELPTWSMIRLVSSTQEKDKTTLVFESNTGPITLEQIKKNQQKSDEFYVQHKKEIDDGNKELEYQRLEISGPKGFGHEKFYIDLYNNNSIYLTQIESFAKDSTLKSKNVMTDFNPNIDFDQNIFDYTRNLPNDGTKVEEIVLLDQDLEIRKRLNDIPYPGKSKN